MVPTRLRLCNAGRTMLRSILTPIPYWELQVVLDPGFSSVVGIFSSLMSTRSVYFLAYEVSNGFMTFRESSDNEEETQET